MDDYKDQMIIHQIIRGKNNLKNQRFHLQRK